MSLEGVIAALPRLIEALPCFGPRRQAVVLGALAASLEAVPGNSRTARQVRSWADRASRGVRHLTVADLEPSRVVEPLVAQALRKASFDRTPTPVEILDRVLGKIEGMRITPFPYQVSEKGTYRILGTAREVVVLGDVGGGRTRELTIEQGHHVTFIDFSAEAIATAGWVTSIVADPQLRAGLLTEGPHVIWTLDDWRESRRAAAFVEAFYPFHPGDLSKGRWGRPDPTVVREFLETALLSKLAPEEEGQGVYVVSEFSELIRLFEEMIEADQRLVCLEAAYAVHPPVRGGFAYLPCSATQERASFLVFRPKA